MSSVSISMLNACKTGDTRVALRYLKSGGFMHSRYIYGALMYNQMDILQIIFRVYPSVFSSSHVDVACLSGHLDIVKWFLMVGIYPSEDGIITCIKYNRRCIMRELLVHAKRDEFMTRPYYVDLAMGYKNFVMARMFTAVGMELTYVGFQLCSFMNDSLVNSFLHATPVDFTVNYNPMAYEDVFADILGSRVVAFVDDLNPSISVAA
jgi:hypothetical protein